MSCEENGSISKKRLVLNKESSHDTSPNQPMFMRTKTRENHLTSSDKVGINKPAKVNMSINTKNPQIRNNQPVKNNLFYVDDAKQSSEKQSEPEIIDKKAEEKKEGTKGKLEKIMNYRKT